MDTKSFLSALGRGAVGGGYIFSGEEEYLKEQALAQIRKLLLTPGMEMMDEQITEEQSPSARDLKAMTGAPPFMSKRRLVVIRDDPRFRVKRRKSGETDDESPDEEPARPTGKAAKTEKAELAEIFGHLGEMSTLIFYNRGAVGDSPWLKQLRTSLEVISFDPLPSAEAVPWIRRLARQADVTLEAGTAEFLFEYTGGLLKNVETELAKLAAYVDGRPAGREDVEAVCVESVEYKIFALIDAVLSGRKQDALLLYRKMTEAGEPPVRLLSLISGQIRVWARSGEASRAGMNSQQIAEAMGVKAFVVDKALRQARYNAKDWNRALIWCADADSDFKTGKLSEETAVEYLVLRLIEG